MVVRTPSLVYIYLSIISRNTMNENKVFLLSLSLNKVMYVFMDRSWKEEGS